MNHLAFICHSFPVLDHHSMVECFTNTHGRLRMFAPYTHTKSNRFGGTLQTLNLVTISFVSQKDGTTLTHATCLNSFSGIKQSYKKMNEGYYVVQLIRSMTQLGQENQGVFNVMHSFLECLDACNEQTILPNRHRLHRDILMAEGILSDDHSEPINDQQFKYMLESYTNTPIPSRDS